MKRWAVILLVALAACGTGSGGTNDRSPVLEATANIPAGLAGDTIWKRHMVAVEQVPREEVRPGAFTSGPEIIPYAALNEIPKGTQITRDLLVVRSAIPRR